jgi:hypothetical protein
VPVSAGATGELHAATVISESISKTANNRLNVLVIHKPFPVILYSAFRLLLGRSFLLHTMQFHTYTIG